MSQDSPQDRPRDAGVPGSPLEWVAGTGAFLVELALIGTAAVAARLLVGGVLGWVAGFASAAAVVAVWATWMAPRSRRT